MKKLLVEVTMMKKLGLIPFLMTILLFVSGCSLFEDVNNTLTYVKEATGYVDEANAFAKEVPALAERAVSDNQALIELETKLKDMKQELKAFNELQPPEVVSELHSEIIEHNKKAEEGVDLYLNKIKEGKFDPADLKDTKIFQSLEEMTAITDQIKQLVK